MYSFINLSILNPSILLSSNWNFFENNIGVNYKKIYDRWLNSPHIFIPLHIQYTNSGPLIELYSEAARSYVFGNKIASVVLCRSLMEHILKNYYKVHGENIEKVIYFAESRFPQLTKFNLQIISRL